MHAPLARKKQNMITDKMKNLEHGTETDHQIIDFILKQPRKVLNMGINELAKASFTSPAAVFRLCKKLGVNGFSEFKLSLATEVSTILKLDEDLKAKNLVPSSTVTDIADNISLVHMRSLEFTKQHFDWAQLAVLRKMISTCPRVEIYGEGLNYAVAQLACLNFEEVGLAASAYTTLNPMHIAFKQDTHEAPAVAFLITHTGMNTHMLAIARQLSEADYWTVAVCDRAERPVAHVCDQHISILTTENTIELSNFVYISSLQYLFDTVVAMRMVDTLDQVRLAVRNEEQIETRNKLE